MKCITNPPVSTWLIIYNDQGFLTTAFVEPHEETCTQDNNTIEEYTNEQEYTERCDELGIEPLIPPLDWYVIYDLNKNIYRIGFGVDGIDFIEDNIIKLFHSEQELEQWVDNYKEPGFYQWQAENLTEIFSPESLKYKPK